MRYFKWAAIAAALLAGGAVSAKDASSSASGGLKGAKRVTGTVENVQGDKITVKEQDKTEELTLSGSSKYFESSPVTKDDLKTGSNVHALVMPRPDGTFEAVAIGIAPSHAAMGSDMGASMAPKGWTAGSGSAIPSGTGSTRNQYQPRPVTGTIESVQGDKVTIRDSQNKMREIGLSDSTKFIQSRPITKDDVKQGEQVVAFVKPGKGTSQVLAIRVMQASSGASTGSEATSGAGAGGTSGTGSEATSGAGAGGMSGTGSEATSGTGAGGTSGKQ
jgi:hypothetical protein